MKLFSSLALAFLSLDSGIKKRIDSLMGFDLINSFIDSTGDNLNTTDITWASHHLRYLKGLAESTNLTLKRLSVLCVLNLVKNGLDQEMVSGIGLHISLRKLASCGDRCVEELSLLTLSQLFHEPLSGSRILRNMCCLANDFEAL